MKKLITLNDDGRLALRGANGSMTEIPPRRTPNALLLIDVSQSMCFIDWLTDGTYIQDTSGESESCAIGQARKGGAKFAYEASAKGYAVALAIFADRAAMVCDPTTDP